MLRAFPASCSFVPLLLPPPRLRPHHSRLGLPCPVYLAGRGRGCPGRSAGHPLPRSPDVMRDLGRRRGGGLVVSRDERQETTSQRPPPRGQQAPPRRSTPLRGALRRARRAAIAGSAARG